MGIANLIINGIDKINSNEFECPHCGGTDLNISDCFDIEVTFDLNIDNDVVLRKINGYCGDCGAHDLIWTEVYEFKRCKDIRINN